MIFCDLCGKRTSAIYAVSSIELLPPELRDFCRDCQLAIHERAAREIAEAEARVLEWMKEEMKSKNQKEDK